MFLVAGCSRKPAALHRAAIQAEAEARRAFELQDAEAADRAAARAEDAMTKLKGLADSGKFAGPGSTNLLQETKVAATSSRNYAQLAVEEQQCRTRLASLKVKAYQGVRDAVCNYGLGGLAPLAEQAARADTNALSPVTQQLISMAWSLANFVGERATLTNGTPDWAGVAADLRTLGTNPPPQLGLFLALAFAASGFTDFALCEIESVDASRLAATNTRSLYHLERGALYALQGWDRTAARELRQAMQLSPNGWSGLGTTQALAVFHFWLADHAIQRKHFAQADLEFGEATKAWPDNPLAPFLKGEQLAAHGEWGKAADSLEAQATATKDPWLAKRLVQRAQEFRAGKDSTPLLFSDPLFVVEIVVHTASGSAEASAALKKLQDFIVGARAFGDRLAQKLPRQR